MRVRRPAWLAWLALPLGGCASATDLLVPAPSAAPPRPRPAVVVEEGPPPKAPPGLVKEPAPAPPKPVTPPPPAAPPSPPPAAAPPPPPRTAAIPKEPSTPPPVLAPQASAEEEHRMKTQAERRIEGTEKLVQRIDPSRLAREQQENYLTIQSFLSKAREALSTRDVQRAFTLADKAFLLADELSKTPR
jgi:type IV secretory pathway VirB10-like protein